MKSLLKYEAYKLWKRKIVMLSFFILTFFCFLKVQYFQTDITKENTKQDQTILSALNGPVDYTFEKKIEALQKQYETQNPPHNDVDSFKIDELFHEPRLADANYVYNMEIYHSILYMKDSPLKNRYITASKGTYVYDSKGTNWATTIYDIDLASYYLIFICLSIAISTIFSHDRERHVEDLLLTTKEGRRKCIMAKLIIAFLTACTIWLTFIALPMVLLYINYGFGGYQGTLSLYFPYNGGVFGDFLTMFFWQCILSFAGMILFTSIVLVISRITNSILIAAIASLTFFAIPLFLNDIPLFHQIVQNLPSFTSRLLTSFGKIHGIQIGNIALLTHEYIIPINLIFSAMITYGIRHSYQASFKERRNHHVKTSTI